MQVVEKPGALPGQCVMPACGSASRSRYLDTGLQFEWYGAVYLCDLCMGEMARMFGFLEPEHVQVLKDKLEAAETDRYLLQRQVDGLRMVVDGFTITRGTGGADSVSAALSAAEVADAKPGTGEDSLDRGTDGPVESVHDSRVAIIPNDESGNEFSSVSDPSPVGLSDEEELRRAGVYAANGTGIGEVLVELDADLAELGIRPDGD